MLVISEPVQGSAVRAYEKHGHWLRTAGLLVLTATIAKLAAQFVWLWVPVPESAQWKPAPVAASGTATSAPKGPDAQLIASAHLFGDYQAPADASLDRMEKAPDTRLNLTLLGILAADQDKGSRALIADGGGDEKPYSVGDKVPGGVKLQAIFPDRVILSRDGQLETLRLDKEKAPSSLQANAAPASSPPSTVSDETTEMLAKVREQLLQDPSKAADYIRVQPANVNGEQRGYRIYPGRDRSLFNNAGLRPGDIVTSLNGTPLSDPAQALQMLADVSHSPTLSLTIERGGVQQNVVVNFH